MPIENEENVNSESIAKQLINENQESKEENLENHEVQEEEKVKDNSDLANSEITEELAEVLGLPKSFIGKPLSEAGKSYKNAVTWESKNNRLIKNLQSEIGSMKDQFSQSQIKKIESKAVSQTEDELGEIPDPVTDNDNFKKWIKNYTFKLKESTKEEILSSIKKDEDLELYKSFNNDRIAEYIGQSITTSLKESLDVDITSEEAIAKFVENNPEEAKEWHEKDMFLKRPEQFIKSVIRYYKANSFDDLRSSKESEINKQIHNKVKENLQGKRKIFKQSSVKPEDVGNNSIASQIIADLEKSRNVNP